MPNPMLHEDAQRIQAHHMKLGHGQGSFVARAMCAAARNEPRHGHALNAGACRIDRDGGGKSGGGGGKAGGGGGKAAGGGGKAVGGGGGGKNGGSGGKSGGGHGKK